MIIGIGPISYDSVKYYMENGSNFEESKLLAINEFLEHFLGYADSELKELTIAEMQLSGKGDIIYAAFKEKKYIKEIHFRMAES